MTIQTTPKPTAEPPLPYPRKQVTIAASSKAIRRHPARGCQH